VAAEVLETLKKTFFDLNEIRVSTVKELSEVMQPLADPPAAAARLKGILQSVFESEYAFDLESLKKQNLGVAIKRLQKLDGASSFVVAYAVQTALAGHSIPVDKGTLAALFILGLINENEWRSGNPPAMERAIPKSKGQEFGSLLHQLGAELTANPMSPQVREILLSIAPDAKDRLPKRGVKKLEPPPLPEPVGKKKAGPPAAKPVANERADKAKEKPLPPGKKPLVAAKKPPEPARRVEPPKKKPAAKAKPHAKPLAKRKPR